MLFKIVAFLFRMCTLLYAVFFYIQLGTSIAYGQTTDSTITVRGIIDTVPNARYYFSYIKYGEDFEDTVRLDSDRKFEYATFSKEPFRLFISIDNAIGTPWYDSTLVGNYTVYDFWVEPGKIIYLEGKKGRGNQVVKNSLTEETALRHLESRKNLRNEFQSHPIKLSKRDLSLAYDSVDRAFITKNIDSYVSLNLLFGMIKFEKNPDNQFIEKQLDRLPANLQHTYLAQYIRKRIRLASVLRPGNVMPDFKQEDTTSSLVRLSDFRGKYVLIDFWASWCGPCRKAHPHLVEAYKKYAERGFDILGVSLDESRIRWLEAIEEDGLNWTQVSDLKGFDNAVAKKLFIHAIPDNFLLDPNGVIIARGLTGAELLSTLEAIFER